MYILYYVHGENVICINFGGLQIIINESTEKAQCNDRRCTENATKLILNRFNC